MDSECQTYELPQSGNHDACAALHDFLGAVRGKPVSLDGQNVRRTSARMALIMLSARRTWGADGLSFDITGPSDSLVSGLTKLGLSNEVLAEGGTE